MAHDMSDIEKILAEREKIDQLLKSKFSKKITVMFTDIKGSTALYDSRGDIDGRVMVHRHNEIVLPILKEHRGELLKTIGDATMTVFDSPEDGLASAVAVQTALKEFNHDRPPEEQIHVRIGLNYGTVIVEKGDVFGDVVNVASRVESLAGADEILITGEMYRLVRGSDDFIFRYAHTAPVKGKRDALKVYRVLWHEEELYMGKTRAPEKRNEGLFVLEASRMGPVLKISAYGRADGEERPVKSYREIAFHEKRVGEYTKGIIELLNRANRRGKIGGDLLAKLKDYGSLLFDELIPGPVKDELRRTREKNLMISIDDELVSLPWELLCDGKEFLCQRFSMGRSVSTKQQVSPVSRALGRPLKMQLLADPGGDLKASYEEAVEISDEIGRHDDMINLSLKTTDIRCDYVKAKIRNFDIVHFAGHAEHNAVTPGKSGWVLTDGRLTAEEVMSLSGAMPMPALVFSNACQSGQTGEWKLEEDCEDRIFGLANAFLLSGVQHYIGTFWEIPDVAGSYFAVNFYRNVAQGASAGEAVRLARMALIDRYGEDTIVWASYMLYGDPTTAYVHPGAEALREEPVKKSGTEDLVSSELRHKEQVIHIGGEKKASRILTYGGTAFLVIAIIMFLAFQWSTRQGRNNTNVAVPPAGRAISAQEKEDTRKRIDGLVAALAAKYREGTPEAKKESSDEWTSRPVTMALMDVTASGTGGDNSRENLKNFLPLVLQRDVRVNMVEREILDSLLQELKLSSSDLADPATALKLGRVLSARFIVTGSIMSGRGEQAAILRIIDTETTAVKKVISAESADGISKAEIETLGEKISAWVREDYPLQGRIVSITGDRCRINLGQMHGLKQGDRFEVLNNADDGSGFPIVFGEIEIEEIGNDWSGAVVLSQDGALKREDKVRGKKREG